MQFYYFEFNVKVLSYSKINLNGLQPFCLNKKVLQRIFVNKLQIIKEILKKHFIDFPLNL